MSITTDSSDQKPTSKHDHILQMGLQSIKWVLGKRFSVQVVFTVVVIALLPYLFLRFDPLRRGSVAHLNNEGLDIKRLIAEVKKELQEADSERQKNGEAALFKLESFELEISFLVRASSTQSGQVVYQVVTLDSEVQTGLEKVQRLKLHWTPFQSAKGSVKPTSSPLTDNPPDIKFVIK